MPSINVIYNRDSSQDIISSIVCTRDTSSDIAGHAGLIDANTVYNITDDSNMTLTILELLYPVGAVYIGTMSTCPLAVLGVGTWEIIAENRVLQGASQQQDVGTTVEAGLPNITGNTITDATSNYYNTLNANTPSGAFQNFGGYAALNGGSSQTIQVYDGSFDASRCSSIYGNSNTVQPPAFLVNIWRRTA